MPKYYISDGWQNVVVDSVGPTEACVKALLLGKFHTAMVNGHYYVSEQGLSVLHDEDLLISSDLVNEEYFKKKS